MILVRRGLSEQDVTEVNRCQRHSVCRIYCYNLFRISTLLPPPFLIGYVTSDIYGSVLKGDLRRAANAALYTAPVETVGIVGTTLGPPLIIAYGGYFVPWRHQRWVRVVLVILIDSNVY